jgi:hypothetical protein
MNENTATVIPFDSDLKKAQDMLDLVGRENDTSGPVTAKLQDALTPGFQAEFDPAEAEMAGAFEEDALTEADALASSHDSVHFVPGSDPAKKE